MGRRTLNVITVASAALLAVSILLFVGGWLFRPSDYHVSFGDSLHVGVTSVGWIDSRIAFFDNAKYGPCRGSLIGIVGEGGVIVPPLEHSVVFGDSFGIYYRDYEWPDSNLWTLKVSLWYPIVLSRSCRRCGCSIGTSGRSTLLKQRRVAQTVGWVPEAQDDFSCVSISSSNRLRLDQIPSLEATGSEARLCAVRGTSVRNSTANQLLVRQTLRERDSNSCNRASLPPCFASTHWTRNTAPARSDRLRQMSTSNLEIVAAATS